MYRVLISSNSFGLAEDKPNLIKKFYKYNMEPYFDKIENDPDILSSINGLIVGTSKVSSSVIDKMEKVKAIVKYGIGMDNIDIKYAKKKGITVKNLPAINSEAVAEFTIGMMFSIARKIPQNNNNMLQGKFKKIIGHAVLNKTVGVIGTGSIGKNVATLCRKLGMRVIAYDVFKDKKWVLSNDIQYVDLEFLLINSDFITVHVPLNKYTKNLIDKKELSLIKESAYLLNISRGGIINEFALYEALINNRLAGAALDVYGKEPPKDNSLVKLDNVVATPHIAALTYETLFKMDEESIRILSDLLICK